MSSGVYELKCADCSAVYIGQSGRKISTRVKEHKSQFNKFKDTDILVTKSAVGKSPYNIPSEDNIRTVHTCDKGKQVDLLENLEINKAFKISDK